MTLYRISPVPWLRVVRMTAPQARLLCFSVGFPHFHEQVKEDSLTHFEAFRPRPLAPYNDSSEDPWRIS
jgi:hypothetical protein